MPTWEEVQAAERKAEERKRALEVSIHGVVPGVESG